MSKKKNVVKLVREIVLLFKEWLKATLAGEPDGPAEGPREKPGPCLVPPPPPSYFPLPENIQAGFPHDNLRRFGCYFFCLLRWAQEISNRNVRLSHADIISIFMQCVAQGYITETAFVNDPIRLLNFLSKRSAVSRMELWTNDPRHPVPVKPIFVRRESHPTHGAHFLLDIGGRRWDSIPIEGRTPAGFRVLV